MASRRKKQVQETQEAPVQSQANKLVGNQVFIDIYSVKPNEWNPNEMSGEMFASLKHGLEKDGWFASQSLLIWGKDETGKEHNVIIDGEHRWTAARELGYTTVPAVYVNGLSANEAKALTIKLNSKRGVFDALALIDLIHEIAPQMEQDSLGLEFGVYDDAILDALMSEIAPSTPREGEGQDNQKRLESTVKSTSTHVMKRVILFFNDVDHAVFDELVKKLSGVFKHDNVSDVVLEALREAISNKELH